MASYILGTGTRAEFRLELLNELTSAPFIEAMKLLPNKNMRIVVLGCGSCHLEERLSHIFSHSHFIGIDNCQARLEEAEARIKRLNTTNSYQLIKADLTTMDAQAVEPCDILISRFVLSHLPQAIEIFSRFQARVREGGYFCLEEGASTGSDYYCSTQDEGYSKFISLIPLQEQAQKSSFETGFKLLSHLSSSIVHCHMTQPVLRTARHKSILRLGIEEGRKILQESSDELIELLHKFEENEKAYGLYMRSIAIIAKQKAD